MTTLNYLKEHANDKKALLAFAFLVLLLASPATQASAAEIETEIPDTKPVTAQVSYVAPDYSISVLSDAVEDTSALVASDAATLTEGGAIR